MKITFVLPHAGMSGGSRVLAIYADRLYRRGHQVMTVSLPAIRPSLFRKLRSIIKDGEWPTEAEPSYFCDVVVPHRVLESVRPVTDDDVPNADIVLATFWKTGEWVAALSPEKGAKAFFLQGYETSPGEEDPWMDEAWRLPLRKIVISKWLVELARARFGDTDVHLVPNSVETTQFNAPPRDKQDIPTVGMLYSKLHLKGVDTSLNALTRMRHSLGKIRVIAFGADRVSRSLPLPNWVEFHYRPAQQEIPKLYAQCDVWLCGSRREGFHLPPLEAMACRCPVVSTRVGGPLDVIKEGINGFLVDVEDSTALAERLIKVLTLSAADWQQMAAAAHATAISYSWDDATDLLEAALRDIVTDAKTQTVEQQ